MQRARHPPARMEGGTGDNAAAAGQDSAVGQVLYAAFQTVLNILLLNLVGVALAWYPRGDNLSIDARGLLTQSTIQALSRLSVTVFLPCLISASLAKGEEERAACPCPCPCACVHVCVCVCACAWV